MQKEDAEGVTYVCIQIGVNYSSFFCRKCSRYSCWKTATCTQQHEHVSGIIYKIVGCEGDVATDHNVLCDALLTAQNEGYFGRDEGIERLLSDVFTKSDRSMAMVLAKKKQKARRCSKRKHSKSDGDDLVSSVVSAAWILGTPQAKKEYVMRGHHFCVSQQRLRPQRGQHILAAVPIRDLRKVESELGFCDRELAVEDFLGRLNLNDTLTVVFVLSRIIEAPLQERSA